MKRIIFLTIAFFLLGLQGFSQSWSTSNGNLYTTTNVGIGITVPKAKLHVESGANTDASILATSHESNKLIVKSGTTSPVHSTVFKIEHEYGTNRNNGFISFLRGGSNNDGYMQLGTSGIARMTINGVGNVGIGMTPVYKLDVNGKVRVLQEFIINGSGDQLGGALKIRNNHKTQPGQASEWMIINATGIYGNSLQ